MNPELLWDDLVLCLVYLLPLAGIWIGYARRRIRRQRTSWAVLQSSRESGLMEPPSLHPLINPIRCLGCGSCVEACPEHQVLGVIAGKSVLTNPSNCIGHGACKDVCPFDAITLVLGTENRGIEIPVADAEFQTQVPGIFVAGELRGMGLIRNAIEQGRQVIGSVRKLDGIGRGPDLDVVIIGAGPAGFAASLAAKKAGLRFVTLEQDTLGGTVAHYPRGKIVMTAPVELPMFGKVRFRETTKEALLSFWKEVEAKTKLTIHYRERVETVMGTPDGLEVKTSRGSYRARAVVLAIGRRGTPRKLDAPGEESSKVVYRLVDPEQYRGQKVLVVGGGDSALEAATSVADETDTTVHLSYRSAAFSRAKPKNRERVDRACKAGRLHVLMESKVQAISPSHVWIETRSGVQEIENDAVIVCAGGILPTGFLRSIGIEVEAKHGTPLA